mmetsp:Transcript_18792/g.31474  ORF Transcript_18792/g.31474 Transcript_18792/m.31474 type:complete len:290 (-) Transcript_18792:497-1366(-)
MADASNLTTQPDSSATPAEDVPTQTAVTAPVATQPTSTGTGSNDDPDYDEDQANLDAIEKEMSKAGLTSTNSAEFEEFLDQAAGEQSPAPSPSKETTTTGTSTARKGFVPSAAVPRQNGKLSSYAAEFWFPECRFCTCCNGFKHGCACCRKGDGTDTCQATGCEGGGDGGGGGGGANSAPTGSTSSNSPSISISTGMPPPPAGTASAGGSPAFCTYEMSPQGCRFGSGCRFRHQNPAAPSPARAGMSPPHMGAFMPPVSPAGGGGSAVRCTYFAWGNCQFGDNCRFAHV